jgi:hypothetical protein
LGRTTFPSRRTSGTLPDMLQWYLHESFQCCCSYEEPFTTARCAQVKRFGSVFDYFAAPRAEILRRDAQLAVNVTTMQRLIRYNDWQHDPLSQGRANFQIASRGDLIVPANASHPSECRCWAACVVCDVCVHGRGRVCMCARVSYVRAGGATDAKITSSSLMAAGQVLAISSPTYDQQPPFQWSSSPFGAVVPHRGQPDVFDFPWVTFHVSV